MKTDGQNVKNNISHHVDFTSYLNNLKSVLTDWRSLLYESFLAYAMAGICH